MKTQTASGILKKKLAYRRVILFRTRTIKTESWNNINQEAQKTVCGISKMQKDANVNYFNGGWTCGEAYQPLVQSETPADTQMRIFSFIEY